MNWNNLNELSQIDQIIEDSKKQPIVVFKHSTRCSISATSLNRLERAWNVDNTPAYLLDLIAFRTISNQIADTFQVEHQSPQVLVIDQGKCSYHASHWDISMDELKPYISQ
ncbi:bacillithiol system redox-active protein YtxJ [Aquirufa rosea]|uniref:Bacillithiol system redox-active protein YtxJ n=1 Tax=Aquirufa rosea TaxID=2509241 RepID=A0A4Q1BY65_9BACT|nr:bacillithiol system redox-active protein YtxJ [Aquirufa rosea]RXK47664.1 bacillithiol system redox-active protein YtxJ [Aquirufa rosea]